MTQCLKVLGDICPRWIDTHMQKALYSTRIMQRGRALHEVRRDICIDGSDIEAQGRTKPHSMQGRIKGMACVKTDKWVCIISLYV